MRLPFPFTLTLTFTLTSLLLPAAPLFERHDLFEEKTAGFVSYRIPGIVVTAKGTVLVYCEARKNSGADWGEIEIHLRRSTDGGRTFSPALQIAHRGPRVPRHPVALAHRSGQPDEQTVNNPVAIAARDGTVHILYCVEYQRAFQSSAPPDTSREAEPPPLGIGIKAKHAHHARVHGMSIPRSRRHCDQD